MGKRGRPKRGKPSAKPSAGEAQKQKAHTTQWKYLLALPLAFAAYVVATPSPKASQSPHRWQKEQFTIPIEQGGSFEENVVVLRNFLPPELAEQLYENMEIAWRGTRQVDFELKSQDKESAVDGNSSWIFTTNEGNTKIRSNANISSRHAAAIAKFRSQEFAYSKWELLNKSNHELLLGELGKEHVRATLEGLATFEEESIMGVADLFFTAYAKGNFLSIHNDGGTGSVALVVSFAKDWKEEYGGKLCFFCMDSMSYCKCVLPEFNSAIIFRSKPRYLFHAVTTVEIPDNAIARRYALTTWFVTNKDLKDPTLKKRVENTNIYLF